MNHQFLLGSQNPNSPTHYNFNGVDSNGDTQVDLYSIPDAEYTIRFNLTIPQPNLTTDSTVIKVPDHLVAQLAYAKAVAERGEDAGVSSVEAYSLYRNSLSDAIAIERNHYLEEVEWINQ